MLLEFEPISLDRQEEYRAALSCCPQLMTSDFAFANIWGWAEYYQLEWAFHKGLVWIRQNYPEPACWAPVGHWGDYDWASCKAMRECNKYIRVPEYLSTLWAEAYGDSINLAEKRDQWDYVYSVEELVALRGNKFHKKKNLLNQFAKNYEWEYKPMCAARIDQVLTMQAEWIKWFEENNPSEALVAENTAITRVLTNFDNIGGLFGATLNCDGKVIAYTVAEPLCQDTVVIHFEKGNVAYKGIYQAINQMFLKNDAPEYTYVNREQDLGDEGLRKAKLSYNPTLFLKKFEATIE
ncbi:DUF2156 domain-containing protein [Salidesulfovibrio onnuriiensis]|uniref:DUF2156 domain-containing protein n=1 Tax=Salidesulfovibrio onnuriiensis TaxID=2583823 RepID=UPI0011C93968|nr:phosphatidylglycerol lysyltransferase domain-containing protein [Salidesulfovibrio onnuriiensis]